MRIYENDKEIKIPKYLTCYFGMFLLIPFLNLGLNHFNQKQLTALVLAIFVFFITIPTIIKLDPFILSNGYSLIWLCILYLIGGYLKKTDILSKIHPFCGLLIYLAAILATWYLRNKWYTQYVSYTSPTIFIGSIALLAFFSNLKIKSNFLKNAIDVLTPASLGVYIIHVNPLVYWRILADSTTPFLQYNTSMMLLRVLLAAFGIYMICSLIDLVRIVIFKKLKIKEKTALLDDLFHKFCS